jgi:WD40 repeat protein
VAHTKSMDCMLATSLKTRKSCYVINVWKWNSEIDTVPAPSSSSSSSSSSSGNSLTSCASHYKLYRTLQSHINEITCIAFSPDNSRLASAGQDSVVIVWEIDSGRKLMQLVQRADKAHSVCFSGTGNNLITGSWSTVRIWDLQTQQTLALIPSTSNRCRSVCLMRGGSMIVSITTNCDETDGYVTCWDVVTYEEMLRHHFPHAVCHLSPRQGSDNEVALSFSTASHQGGIIIFDLHECKTRFELPVGERMVANLCYNSSGSKLISCTFDGTVTTWDATTGGNIASMKIINGILGLSVGPHEEICVAAIEDRELWWIECGEVVDTWKFASSGVICYSNFAHVVLM